ncbi:uncharacterized protein FMAN_13127 [Fusarium mangiferae]|uniref:Uncharacterized protein n=1 Tax=Fusarium mangiferae TaxID=192010 RepID=A0A1L7THR3_FUSMA|nr:uncharacterized protein FMAN_13127 [Fusarium mangiferae]CVK94801.1 uncharacterized protein FMAN_13127 [Fusarium mangiferae]
MATQELVTAKVKHKRVSTPKSRNGCITCKYVALYPLLERLIMLIGLDT